MSTTDRDAALPFGANDDHEIELAVVDLRVARAFWEGVPTARLLARIPTTPETEIMEANSQQ